MSRATVAAMVVLCSMVFSFLGRLEGYAEGAMSRGRLPDAPLPGQLRPPCPHPAEALALASGRACFLPYPADAAACRASEILYLDGGRCWAAAYPLDSRQPATLRPQ